MNYITIENLSLNYGDKIIFEDLNFYINKGDKISLVAKNGSGKTSLLKILFNEELPSSNSKILISKDIKLGYLRQDPIFGDADTVKDYIFKSDSEMFRAVMAYKQAVEDPDKFDFDKAMADMERLEGWDIDLKIELILEKLEVNFLNHKIKNLSGGQKKRVALASILIDEPDMILLDEPTNHLDPYMIEWLEDYLSKSNLTLLLISHDRYFIDSVCNQILELENGVLQKYSGNYSDYIEKKNLNLENLKSYTDKAKNLYKRELAWIRKQPKARGTKSKKRVEGFDKVESEAKVEIKEENVILETVENRLGSKILEFKNATKNFGELKIIEKFDYKFRKNEKVGIIGKNGVGKSTFIKLILGLEPLDKGEITFGDTVKVGYYSQEVEKYDNDKRLIEAIRDVAENIPLKGGKSYSASQMLERFLFDKNSHYTQISKLSGGEKRRLSLIMVLMQNPNFLILDEPTNDLDIVTLNVLQEFLENFEGCVILITHDRFFMDNTVEHLFVFEGNGEILDYYGTYTEYFFNKDKKTKTKSNILEKDSSEKNDYLAQKEIKQLEGQISKLEKKIKDLSDKISVAVDLDEINVISNEIEKCNSLLEEKTNRWIDIN